MRLEAVELRLVDAGMRRSIGTAAGPHLSRPVAVVRVLTDVAQGWGECAALPGGTAVDPPLAAVWEGLRDWGVPRLIGAAGARGGELPPAPLVASLFETRAEMRMAAATLEMAVLDAELRHEGRSLWERLGVPAQTAAVGVPVGALVGIPPDRSIDTLVASVAQAAPSAARVRIKIAPGWDIEPVRAVRGAFADLALQVDANGSYRLDGDGLDAATRLADLDEFALVCIEQPLAPADLVSHAQLGALMQTPICLDESLTTGRRLTEAIRYGACTVACLKPGRLGGLLAARRAAATCSDAGVRAFVGGFFETGFARTANVALAGLRGFGLPGDLSDPSGYLAADPFSYVEERGGTVRPYGGPGVARAPDPAALEAVTEVVELVRAGP